MKETEFYIYYPLWTFEALKKMYCIWQTFLARFFKKKSKNLNLKKRIICGKIIKQFLSTIICF